MFALSSVAFLWRSIVNDHTDDFQCFEDAVEIWPGIQIKCFMVVALPF